MGTFIAVVNRPFERIFLVLLPKFTYKIPPNIPTKQTEIFLGFPYFLQTNAVIGP